MEWFLGLGIAFLVIYSAVITVVLIKRSRRFAISVAQFKTSRANTDLSIEKELRFQQAADEALRLNKTFQKFVPRQFVDHFAMGGAESLKLGYANNDEVAVMFCDIRGFTGLSEQMTPQQLMNFLNSYFLRMNAPIHDNFGFIDKFIGDAIMALFDHPDGQAMHKAADAINAALGLQKALKLYNQHRSNSGYAAIKNGVGLHYGPVVLGTVGSDDRMDTTVIGDTVNIAQRIESLTDPLGIDIMASQALVDEALKHMSFSHRLVDNVVLKGRSTSVDLVEIYEHLHEGNKYVFFRSAHARTRQ